MLRQRLQELTQNEDVDSHPHLLVMIAAEYPHTIDVAASPHPINRYTCLMHVFDLMEKPEYIAIANWGLGNVFAGADFAHWLIDNDELTPLQADNAQAGDLVMYFRDGAFKHVGLLQGSGRVLSKWGQGNLYEHGVLEVPNSYGDDVRYYESVGYEDAFDAFTRFAEEQGIPFEDGDPHA